MWEKSNVPRIDALSMYVFLLEQFRLPTRCCSLFRCNRLKPASPCVFLRIAAFNSNFLRLHNYGNCSIFKEFHEPNEQAIIRDEKLLADPFSLLFDLYFFLSFFLFGKPMNNQSVNVWSRERRVAEKWNNVWTHARKKLLFLPIESTFCEWFDGECRIVYSTVQQ